MTLGWDEAEIARRIPLWTALADLFLDTDVMLNVPHIARTILESGYTLEEAEAALRWEVRPAFYTNLLNVAGEWSGWPPETVQERVLKVARGRMHRWLVGDRRFMPNQAWHAVVAEVGRLRAG